MGCYNPSPLTEISSRDLWKEGGAQDKRWRMHYSWRKEDIKIVQRRKTSQLRMSLFLSCVHNLAHCGIRCASQLYLCCTPSFDLLGSTTWAKAQKGKRTSSYPKVKGDILHQAGTSKMNQSLAHSTMIFSGTLGLEGYTSTRLRSWPHGLRVDWRHVEYSLKLSDTRTPTE
jgi:hypothetical protein